MTILFLVGITTYLFFPLGYNQNNFQHFGLILKNGGLPYIDFMDRRGPVALYIYALPFMLFDNSEIGYRFFDLIVSLSSGYFIYLLARLNFRKITSYSLVVIWFVNAISNGPGNTGDVTNLIVLFTLISVYLLSKEKKPRNTFYYLGLLTAAIFYVKPTGIVIFLPFIGYQMFKSLSFKTQILIQFVIGFISVFVPTLLILHYIGILNDYIEVQFTDPMLYYTDRSFFYRFSIPSIKKIIVWVLSNPVFIIFGFLGLILKNKLKSSNINILRSVFAGCCLMIFLEAKYYPYHFSIILPFLVIGTAHFLTHTQYLLNSSTVFLEKHIKSILIFILCIKPLYIFSLPFINYSEDGKINISNYFVVSDLKEQYQEKNLLVNKLKEFEISSLFVIGNDAGIYNAINIAPKSKYSFHGQILCDNPKFKSLPEHRIRWRKEYLEFIRNEKPQYLIIDQKLFETITAQQKDKISKLIDSSYNFEFQSENYLTYRIKNE